MKNNYKDIAELVARVKNKDVDAFVELYNNMYHQVYFLALTIVKDVHLAQDVVQETFINVYTSIHSLNNDMTFIAWLNRITYNCSLKMISRNEEMPVDNDLVENVRPPVDREEPLEMVLSKEKTQSLIEMILELAPEYRTALILKYYEGMKLEEIASCMECSVGTIKSRLSRGKNALRKHIVSSGRFFMVLAVGGFSMAFSIKSYAKESMMSAPAAETTLNSISHKIGIAPTFGFHAALGAAGILSGKKFMIGITTLAFLIGGGIWGNEAPSIAVHYTDDVYTNSGIEISIAVDTIVPIKSIQATSDKNVLPIVPVGKAGEYKVKAEQNGSFQIEVVLWNGRKKTETFEVSKIDKVIPELYWYSWDRKKSTFYCLVKDNLSGIDYSKIYQIDKDGRIYAPVSSDKETGEVEFRLSDVPFKIKIFDNANNFSIYKIESYVYEEGKE